MKIFLYHIYNCYGREFHAGRMNQKNCYGREFRAGRMSQKNCYGRIAMEGNSMPDV